MIVDEVVLSLSQERRERRRSSPAKEAAAAPPPEEEPAKLLDNLFNKTKAQPHIYWLPLTDQQVCRETVQNHLSFISAWKVIH